MSVIERSISGVVFRADTATAQHLQCLRHRRISYIKLRTRAACKDVAGVRARPDNSRLAKELSRVQCTSTLAVMLINGLGSAAGNILGQGLSGGPRSGSHSLQLGLCNSILDARQKPQQIASTSHPATTEASATSIPSRSTAAAIDPFWISASACLLFAVLKLVQGQPDLVLSSCQDKLLSMAVANHLLWPLVTFLNTSIVPKQHRPAINMLIHTVWSACLSSLGYAPSVATLADTLPDLQQLDSTVMMINNLLPDEVLASATQAAQTSWDCVVSPVASQAASALQSATDMLESIPSALLQEVLSSTLDLVTPVRRLSKRPSQLNDSGTCFTCMCHSSV